MKTAIYVVLLCRFCAHVRGNADINQVVYTWWWCIQGRTHALNSFHHYFLKIKSRFILNHVHGSSKSWCII